jgi:WD40 repeat protein
LLLAGATTVLIFASCSSDRPGTPPPPASATAVPAGAEATAVAAPVIGPENADRLEVVTAGTVPGAERLAWSPAEALFVASRQSSYIVTAAGEKPRELLSVAEPEAILDVSSQGLAATTADSMRIDLRAAPGNKVVASVQPGSPVTGGRFSPDGSLFVTSQRDRGGADVWNAASGQLLRQLAGFQTAAPVYSVAFSADGKSLVWLSRGIVQLQDIVTGSLGPRLSHPDFVADVAVSPDGGSVATALAATVQLWDAATGAAIARLDQPDQALGLAYSPDGRLLAVATSKGIALWDTSLRKMVKLVGPAAAKVAFSPSGRALAALGQDGGVTVVQAR